MKKENDSAQYREPRLFLGNRYKSKSQIEAQPPNSNDVQIHQ